MMKIFNSIILIVTAAFFYSCSKSGSGNNNNSNYFIRGLDLSFTPEISGYSINYSSGGTVKPILQIAKEKGINTIRVRLWYNPSGTNSALPEVVSFAKQIKQAGLKFWLDIHYSDTWADPGTQNKPAAWTALSMASLKDSIYAYTKRVITACVQNNARPDIVQPGNEINNGFLWESGKIYTFSGPNWGGFAYLMKESVRAIRETSAGTKIILHHAGNSGAATFFTNIQTQGIDYDIIGLSYYPWWHGADLNILRQDMTTLASTFQKPVLIAETAYPFTLNWADNTNNIVGSASQVSPDYDATADGQASFISKLISITKASSAKQYSGVCYWAPDWVAFKGTAATDGSPYENLALFDFSFKALPALDSLGNQ